MASLGQQITVATTPTLIFECIDRETYIANGFSRGSNPNIFIGGTPNDPIPILITFPSGSTVYLGGSNVTATGGAVPGCPMTGIPTLTDNVVGGDSMYACTGTGTVILGLLTTRQNSGA